MPDTLESQDVLTKAQNDLKSLDRVSHRLALLTDDKLPEILDKLLPRLLLRIGENHQALVELGKSSGGPLGESSLLLKQKYDAIHAKLIETLSHVMKRARVDAQCGLPCQAILELLIEESEARPKRSVDPFTMNLSLAFLTIGVPRCRDFGTLLAPLLILFGYSSYETYFMESTNSKRLQSNQFAHLLLKCLEGIVVQEQQQVRQSASSSVRSSGSNPTNPMPQSTSTAFHQAKQLLQRQDSCIIASSTYDLLLDVLLFQPTRQDSPIPPDGLSASGAHRLVNGPSATARDWLAEMAIPARRHEMKQRLLDLMAPSRMWALFMSYNDDVDTVKKQQSGTKTDGMDESIEDNRKNLSTGSMNLSRTLSLLVVASGDPALDVADRAKSYLKVYFDSFRGKSLLHGLGNVITLSIHLLSLTVGEQQADAAVDKAVPPAARSIVDYCKTLGTQRSPMPADSLQAVLNSKRRPVSESTMTALAQFVATNVFQDQPILFDEVELGSIKALSALCNLLASRTLSGVSSASGLTKLKGRPFAAAADLLNAFVIRLATYYDSQSDEQRQALNELMADSMSVACSVLNIVASRPSTTTNQRTAVADEGNVSVRDSSYGVLCTMFRSQFVQAFEGFVFNAGEPLSDSTNGTLSVSIKTAKLLFGCAANEEEKLRHRAVAALDALLAAYCRVYSVRESPTISEEMTITQEATNPWSSLATAAPVSANQSRVQVDKLSLSKSLLPLLWTAAQVHLPKASRIAACRWSSQLLMELDMTSACHILCFLAGDIDPTAASTARQGLGLNDVEAESIPLVSDDFRLPNFAEFVSTIFAEALPTDSSFDRRQRYWDFSQKEKQRRFGLGFLHC